MIEVSGQVVNKIYGLSVSRYRRSLWLYPLFQIPLIFLSICLVAAALCWLLGLGRPDAAVAIALDLSVSDAALQQEEVAVQSYIQENAELPGTPNQVWIFGFGNTPQPPVDPTFETKKAQMQAQLQQVVSQHSLTQVPAQQQTAPVDKNLDAAVALATEALKRPPSRCRILLLLTDGQNAKVSPGAISKAAQGRVKIQPVVVGNNSLQQVVGILNTMGFTGLASELTRLGLPPQLTTGSQIVKFVDRFNDISVKWIILFLGGAWIFLMWMLTLPLDRWVFQDWMKLPMSISGQLAVGNALFWSVATPCIIWGFYRLLGLLNVPFLSQC